MSFQTTRTSVVIVEEPTGWRIDEELFPTAVAALRVVQDRAKVRVEETGICDVTVITWETYSEIGRAVASVLAGR